MNLNNDFNPEFEDDDVFFAELRRQILILTADEEQDFHEKKRTGCGVAMNGGSNGYSTHSSALKPQSYFNWSECENGNKVPAWLVNLWRNRNANGTGVFIPHIVKHRRYRPARRRNESRICRQVGNWE